MMKPGMISAASPSSTAAVDDQVGGDQAARRAACAMTWPRVTFSWPCMPGQAAQEPGQDDGPEQADGLGDDGRDPACQGLCGLARCSATVSASTLAADTVMEAARIRHGSPRAMPAAAARRRRASRGGRGGDAGPPRRAAASAADDGHSPSSSRYFLAPNHGT